MFRATPSPRFVIVSSYCTNCPTATCSALVARNVASMRARPAGGGVYGLGCVVLVLAGAGCGAGGGPLGSIGGGAGVAGGAENGAGPTGGPGNDGAAGVNGIPGAPAGTFALQVIAAAPRASSTKGIAAGPM